jgi:homoserine dehydrogenase
MPAPPDPPMHDASPGIAALPDQGSLRTVRLCLLGFGNVAREFCALLARQERALADGHGLRVLVTAVGTRHGSLLAPDGMSGGAVLEAAGLGPASGTPVPAADAPVAAASGRPTLPDPPRPAADLLAAARADVLVELTVMESNGAPAAIAHIETAFALGMNVVTANKGPIAWSWPHIAELAHSTGRRIRFESTVMDGLPVFSLLELTLLDCRLLGFEAVFNSTTNFMIDAMSEGVSFADALAHAQADGYAEADPAHDIDGWDAACKAAALANVAMDARITPADIERQGMHDVPLERIRQARAEGKRLRLVTTVWREAADEGKAGPAAAADESRAGSATPAGPATSAGPVHGRLEARELTIDHPLASLGDESLGVILHTDLMGDVFVAELGALVPQTAYGVYADLVHLCRTR